MPKTGMPESRNYVAARVFGFCELVAKCGLDDPQKPSSGTLLACLAVASQEYENQKESQSD
jgi:hypothetical protein